MGYRKGYYKKDGTYVQGHYIKTRAKSFKGGKNKGCAGLLLLLIVFMGVVSCS